VRANFVGSMHLAGGDLQVDAVERARRTEHLDQAGDRDRSVHGSRT
jgi:hypothetical protein